MALTLTLTWKKIEIVFPKFPTAHQSVLFTPSLWPLGTKPILIVTLMTLGTRAKVSKQGCILSCRVEGGIKCPSFTTKICLKKIVFLTLHSKWIYWQPFLLLYSFTIYYYRQTQKTVNTWKIPGMLIVYRPITIKFRIRKQTSKPQFNYSCCSWFSYHAPYWLISHNTITFHKYFWCSWFCEFHSNKSV